jgi:hypothetical protein
MIQQSFNRLSPYLKGLKVTDNYNILEANLKTSWKIPNREGIEVKQKTIDGAPSLVYNLFYSSTLSFDEMVDWLKDEIIDYNLEIEEKERLLKAKVEELKRVFETKDLDELNNLKFTTEDDLLRLTSTVDNSPKEENEVNETK